MVHEQAKTAGWWRAVWIGVGVIVGLLSVALVAFLVIAVIAVIALIAMIGAGDDRSPPPPALSAVQYEAGRF